LQTQDLKSINEALPTRGIGEFPGYVATITELIQSAKERVVIVCDAPCYCIFSDHALSADYMAAIAGAKERFVDPKASMSILWMDEHCRRKVLREQFNPDAFDKWKIGIEDKLDQFLRKEGARERADTPTTKTGVKGLDSGREIPTSSLAGSLLAIDFGSHSKTIILPS
jgi:hypothetical protein